MKLARLEDEHGSSKGSWLICEIEGLCALGYKSGNQTGWRLATIGQGWPGGVLSRVWGDAFSAEIAERFLQENPQLNRHFWRRRDLLIAVEQAFRAPKTGALGEFLP